MEYSVIIIEQRAENKDFSYAQAKVALNDLKEHYELGHLSEQKYEYLKMILEEIIYG